MIDKSLSRGLTDFFFVAANEEDETYDYVANMDNDGVILIVRYSKDGNSALYWVGTGTFATIWAARETKHYVFPSQLKDPRV